MQTFFHDIDAIERFTSSLKSTPSLQCQYCAKQVHFVSHGFVYKQHSIIEKEAVGKRIICCNRYGHHGCGRTYQLNIANKLPKRHYAVSVLCLFITFLLKEQSVCQAYSQATGQIQSRQGWRWLKLLKDKLMTYRGYLKVPIILDRLKPLAFKHHRLLLSTLFTMVQEGGTCPCAHFQLTQQTAFI